VARFHPRRLRWWWEFVFGIFAACLARRREHSPTIAIDVTPLWEPLSGIGWYLDRLLAEFARWPAGSPGLAPGEPRFRLYGPTRILTPDAPRPVVELPGAPNVEWVHSELRRAIPFASTTVRILRKLEPLLVALDRNTVLFAPNFFLPRRLSWARGKLVATIHDLGFRVVPDTLSAATRRDLETHFAPTLERATRFITPSEAVRAELIALGLAPDRVRAIHHGAGQLESLAGAAAAPTGEPPFALFVGTLEPRKGLPTLLEAWRVARAERESERVPRLRLVGRWGWGTDALRAACAKAAAEGWLEVLGYVTAERLALLYRQASFVVLPSLYEGFGLPLLESMHAGTPLLASDLPVTREVAGPAAIYAPAGDIAAWAAAILRLSASPEERARLAAEGTRRARGFSWQRAARETVEVLLAANGDARGGSAR
jgi:alpha-1,3-rhamnosyl/mannosyltransferase